MGRPATKANVRLRELEKAKAKIMALPRGELLTSEPMAQVLGVRWPTLREWCRDIEGFEASGAFQGGANGIAYEFCPVRTVWFLIEHFRAVGEKAREKADRLGAMVLGDDAAGAMGGLDLVEMKQVLETQSRYLDIRERARQLVDAGVVTTLLDQAFSRMQEAAITAPQEMDPTGQWSPQVRAVVDQTMRKVLVKQRGAARDAIEGLKQGTG